MRLLTEQLLKAFGVGKISVAKDGAQAYEQYQRYAPDLIITDWQMPQVDGIELTNKIRREKASPNRTIPIIMMTGFIDKNRIDKARDSGVTEFIIKPFSAKDMAKRIEHITKSPRDFVVTNNYIGPSRRRKKNLDFNGKENRIAKTTNIISDKKLLEEKIGRGEVSLLAVERAEQVIQTNTIDFDPIAREFLDQLEKTIQSIQSSNQYSMMSLESLIYPIMQIKANARIFKYDLIGDLASIMLNFLNQVNAMDEFVLQIIIAHQRTINHIINKKQKGKQGKTGQTLQEELEGACKRYLKIKNKTSQDQLKKTSAG